MIKNIKVSGKLTLLAIPAIAALIALLYIYITQSDSIIAESKKAFYDEAYVSTAAILNADRDFYQAQIAEKNLYNNEKKLSGEEKQALLGDFKENAQQVKDRINSALDNIKSNQELYEVFVHPTANVTLIQLAAAFDADYSEWLNTYDLEQSKGDMALRDSAFEEAREHINLMTELLEAYANHKSEEIVAEVRRSITFAAIAVIVVILIISVTAVVIILYMRSRIKKLTDINRRISQGELDIEIEERYFSRDEIGQLFLTTSQILSRLKEYIKYINEISLVLGRMADGDMRVELVHEYVGEFKHLKTALLSISSGLNEALSSINRSAEQVSIGAEQMSSTAQALSAGSTEQAGSTEELAATINEVSRQVSDNAGNASKARELAKKAASEVNNGSVQMSQMIEAMRAINASSAEIEKIIKAIDDIAFQTNILALNAAVEAARAGNEGKGFAVVADEVRNLAAKSAEAAKTTATLIESSISKVEEGSRLADATARSLGEIVRSVEETSSLIDRIDDATAQQAQAIFQISQGITQISTVIQTNSASAEESAATSEELAGQADLLRNEVGKFKLQGSGI